MKVRKITSLNPKRYKLIDYEIAVKQYNHDYIPSCVRAKIAISKIKSFNEWLATEI